MYFQGRTDEYLSIKQKKKREKQGRILHRVNRTVVV